MGATPALSARRVIIHLTPTMALSVSLSSFLENASWQDAGGVDWCGNSREVVPWGADKQELAGTRFGVQENGCDPGAGQGRDMTSCLVILQNFLGWTLAKTLIASLRNYQTMSSRPMPKDRK